jgi:hypothetical protein
MPDSLHIVSIRIQDIGSEVTRVIASLSWRSVIPAACHQGSIVETLHCSLVLRLKGEMDLAGLIMSLVNPKFIG